MIPIDRSIIWGDGLEERVGVDGNAYLYINGVRRNLFGMCINRKTPSGENVTGANELAFYDKILTNLESRGVRLVQIELNPGLAVSGYTQMLDLCRKHHMLVLALIAAWWFIPKTLMPTNFTISSSQGTVSNFFTNCCKLLNNYPNVISISADNEIDLRRSNVNGACTYTAEAARDYMALITNTIRSYPWTLGCPVVTTKIVTLPVSDTFRSACRAYFLPLVDVLGLDTYPDTPAIETHTLSQIRAWANNQGYPPSRAFWQTEYSASQGGIEYKFTPDFLTVAVEGDSPINIAFSSFNEKTGDAIGFFNTDATPKNSLLNIYDRLPLIQGSDIVRYEITVGQSPGGTTNPGPGVYRVNQGESVWIQAIPNTGYHFVRWSDGSLSQTLKSTASANVSISPIFEIDPVPVPVPEPKPPPVEEPPPVSPPPKPAVKSSIGPVALFVVIGVVLSKIFGRKKN